MVTPNSLLLSSYPENGNLIPRMGGLSSSFFLSRRGSNEPNNIIPLREERHPVLERLLFFVV
jgi:hypothetical protein